MFGRVRKLEDRVDRLSQKLGATERELSRVTHQMVLSKNTANPPEVVINDPGYNTEIAIVKMGGEKYRIFPKRQKDGTWKMFERIYVLKDGFFRLQPEVADDQEQEQA